MRARRAAASASSMRPLATLCAQVSSAIARPASIICGLLSSHSTRRPALARLMTIPRPMVPAPITAAQRSGETVRFIFVPLVHERKSLGHDKQAATIFELESCDTTYSLDAVHQLRLSPAA